MTKKLSEKAMLIRQIVSYYDGRKYDKEVSDEIADMRGASKESGRYNKVLFSRDALKDLARIKRECKEYHKSVTLPWDKNLRILNAKGWLDYTQRMKEFKAEYEVAASEFERVYPSLVEEARKTLNGMFKESDYPSVAEIKTKFHIDVMVMPMPDAADFRVALSDSETEEIRASIEQQVNDRMGKAIEDVWNRVYEVVKKMRDVLADADKTIRQSTVDHVREIVDLLPVLNVTGDPQLDKMAKRIRRSLYGLDAEDIRKDANLRERQAKTADDILNVMAGYIGS